MAAGRQRAMKLNLSKNDGELDVTKEMSLEEDTDLKKQKREDKSRERELEEADRHLKVQDDIKAVFARKIKSRSKLAKEPKREA